MEQAYKKVIYGNSSEIQRGALSVRGHSLTNSRNSVWVDENVQMKPKMQHELDKLLDDTFDLLSEKGNANKPEILVLSDGVMQTLAKAAYNPVTNVMIINAQLLKSNLPEKRMTVLHELLHWKDAQSYHVPVTKENYFSAYLPQLRRKSKKRLDDAGINRDNVNDISEYATISYAKGFYEETYTEFRAKNILKGGAR